MSKPKSIKKKHIHKWRKDEYYCCPISECYEAECRCGAVGHFNKKGKLVDVAE